MQRVLAPRKENQIELELRLVMSFATDFYYFPFLIYFLSFVHQLYGIDQKPLTFQPIFPRETKAIPSRAKWKCSLLHSTNFASRFNTPLVNLLLRQ
jgi:hypothetical protein